MSEIIAAVAAEGDAAVRRYTARFDVDPPPPRRVGAEELAHALAVLDPAVRAGLEVAIANVAEVAWAAADDDREVTLAQGQRVLLREMPVARAAVYVPGRPRPVPEHGRDGGRDGAGGRRRRRRDRDAAAGRSGHAGRV